jgi:hypothetical protein
LRIGKPAQIPDVSTEEIQDKSKTDAFARGLALVQCFWLLLELIARWNESLPSSQMEIATPACAYCSIPTYGAVQDKPKDVGIPFVVAAVSVDSGDISLDRLLKRDRQAFSSRFLFSNTHSPRITILPSQVVGRVEEKSGFTGIAVT